MSDVVEPKYKLIQRYASEGEGPVRIDEEEDEKQRELFEELCKACRIGDLERVDSLVTSGANINAIDKFDSTPLIIASLCGHEPVVNYLLNQGAMCDRDTFQGERALYGALNDKIRQLLLQFDISKSVDVLQPFAAHISSFLKKPIVNCFDLKLVLDDDRYMPLHKFVLLARCQYFRDHSEVLDSDLQFDELDSEALRFVIRYFYLYDQALPVKDEVAIAKLIEACNFFKLDKLLLEIDELKASVSDTIQETARRRQALRKADTLLAQQNFEDFLNEQIIARGIKLGEEDSDLTKAQFDSFKQSAVSPDVLLLLDIEDAVIYYPAHRAMLVRSEYYLAMFASAFSEAAEALPVVELPVDSEEVAAIVLQFLYTDKAIIPVELAMEVMHAADMLLIDRLKALAALTITSEPQLPPEMSIYAVIRAAWQLRVNRLELYVARNIAYNLERHIEDEEFRKVVNESANRIRVREETDTIELIDDIRFYLAKRYGIIFEDDQDVEHTKHKIDKITDEEFGISQSEKEYNSQLDRIELLLESLGLEA